MSVRKTVLMGLALLAGCTTDDDRTRCFDRAVRVSPAAMQSIECFGGRIAVQTTPDPEVVILICQCDWSPCAKDHGTHDGGL